MEGCQSRDEVEVAWSWRSLTRNDRGPRSDQCIPILSDDYVI